MKQYYIIKIAFLILISCSCIPQEASVMLDNEAENTLLPIDTTLLDKKVFNRDSSLRISKSDFNNLIESSITLLQTKPLADISDEQHIKIMMCLNTLFMRSLKGGLYEQLEKISIEKNYSRDIIKCYPEWIPNRGGGYYFPKLKMELYGTPMPYAIYTVME